MTTKKLLKLYEVDFIENYFEIVIESKVNNNSGQAKQQYKQIPIEEKINFFNYLRVNYSNDSDLFTFFLHNIL